mmetsp:Transcript_43123/g.108915  ORF Transcript_43123/g.108915 Transcript_43123/m.108915 type:complete len:207 (-) Transcript_43123:978-1598(-)
MACSWFLLSAMLSSSSSSSLWSSLGPVFSSFVPFFASFFVFVLVCFFFSAFFFLNSPRLLVSSFGNSDMATRRSTIAFVTSIFRHCVTSTVFLEPTMGIFEGDLTFSRTLSSMCLGRKKRSCTYGTSFSAFPMFPSSTPLRSVLILALYITNGSSLLTAGITPTSKSDTPSNVPNWLVSTSLPALILSPCPSMGRSALMYRSVLIT